MNFKVGDKVINGHGTIAVVVSIDSDETFGRDIRQPIKTVIKGLYRYYCKDGVYNPSNPSDKANIRVLTPLEELL